MERDDFFSFRRRIAGGVRPLDLLRKGEAEQAINYAKRYHHHGA
jgi:hypothetical protein